MNSQEIRRRFLAFFAENGHAVLPSASLVPENDPTVLFTTAGMQPLVPYLLGQEHPGGKRLVSAQKCLRTVDIEDVGDSSHLTFFEMMGNWSLGDYFKKESINWSWEFLTSKDRGLGLDPSRIYVTVFAGDQDAPLDEESVGYWQEIFEKEGLSSGFDVPVAEGGRIYALGKDSNWWGPAGQSGPCGPDTEIYYDMGKEAGELVNPDGLVDFESPRLLEIWNNVFMQYNRSVEGEFTPLQQHNVDTGGGLERFCMVVQGADDVYGTDLFVPILSTLRNNLPGEAAASDQGMRIMADHLRAAAMLAADGIVPANKDQGYIMRRLIRRAALHAETRETGWIEPVVAVISEIYADSYPRVAEQLQGIVATIVQEVEKFAKTLEKGKKEIAKLENLTATAAFNLYQTYGFPWELSKEYAVRQGIAIAEEDFDKEFERHRALSRTAAAGKFASGLADHSEITVKYHTATHLLHQALRVVLGDSVQQKGSNITPERLRFDFSYPEKMTAEQIAAVEELVNRQIQAALPVSREEMSPEAAYQSGALGFFGHKYGDSVSVYAIGDFSKEICTGPHVEKTDTIGRFKISKEEAVSAGVRRIKAIIEA